MRLLLALGLVLSPAAAAAQDDDGVVVVRTAREAKRTWNVDRDLDGRSKSCTLQLYRDHGDVTFEVEFSNDSAYLSVVLRDPNRKLVPAGWGNTAILRFGSFERRTIVAGDNPVPGLQPGMLLVQSKTAAEDYPAIRQAGHIALAVNGRTFFEADVASRARADLDACVKQMGGVASVK